MNNNLRTPNYASLFVLSFLILAGCSTTGTIASRSRQRAAAYAAFTPEVKALVDEGRIAAGMTTNAVYIAWGPPAEVLQGGDQRGSYTTWIYRGSFLEETRYWAGRRYPYVAYDYEPRTYIRGEIIFVNGVVQSWRTLPQPVY